MRKGHWTILFLLGSCAWVRAEPRTILGSGADPRTGAGSPSADSAIPVAVTLRRCYEWARERSPDLKIRREDVRQSEARGRSALGGILPRLSWELLDTWQDPSGVDVLEKKGFVGFVKKNQVDSSFAVSQPLFSGLREFSAWRGYERESARNTLLLQRADRELFVRTAEAFYAVLSQETDHRNTSVALALAQDRVKELDSFLKLGKARDSEVYTAQAHASALKAQSEQIQARIASAREELSFLTRQDLSAVPLEDEVSTSTAPGDLEEALRQGRQRSDLRAQREEAAGLKLKIRYEKGFYWPSADLTGRYYTQRGTFLDEIQWDLGLSLHVPIYQGGTVSARVREAESAYRQSLLILDDMEHRISYAIRKIHGDWSASLRETRALEEATEAAQKSYDALRREYKLGLVTNLDVLQALDFLQAQNSARDAARLKTKLLFLQLNVAVEKMP